MWSSLTELSIQERTPPLVVGVSIRDARWHGITRNRTKQIEKKKTAHATAPVNF